MKKPALALLAAAVLCSPLLAKGDKKPLSPERKKLSKALVATASAYLKARHTDTVFKKGTLTPRVVGLRPKAVANLFRGFTPKAYRKRVDPKRLMADLLQREGQGHPPALEGVALAFNAAKLVRFNLHREVATVEAEVDLFTGGRSGNRVAIHQVWTLEKKRWALSLRKAKVPRRDWGPEIGAVPGTDWSDPGDGIAANALAVKIEEAYLKGQRSNEAFAGTRVADFGRVFAVEILENHKRVRIRCGHLNVALLVDLKEPVEQIPLDSRVLFRGEVHQLNMNQPWARLNYELGGRTVYWKHIHVGLRAGEVTLSE